MWKADVIRFFGDQYGAKAKVARALGISRQAVNGWGDLIPENSARRLAELTKGQLVFDESLYRDRDAKKKRVNRGSGIQSLASRLLQRFGTKRPKDRDKAA